MHERALGLARRARGRAGAAAGALAGARGPHARRLRRREGLRRAAARRAPSATATTSSGSRAPGCSPSRRSGRAGSSRRGRTSRRALARWRPEHRAVHLLRYGQDPELVCLIRLAHTLWLLGHDRRGGAHPRRRARARPTPASTPTAAALVNLFAAVIALDQRDDERLRAHVEALAGTAGRAGRARRRGARRLRRRARRSRRGRARPRPRASWTTASAGEPAAPGEQGLLVARPGRGVRAGRRPAGGPGGGRPRGCDGQRRAAVGRRDPPPARRVPRRRSAPRPRRSRPSCGAPSRPREEQGAR